jgi:5-methylcytosine-specific restriction endonuclease McrA
MYQKCDSCDHKYFIEDRDLSLFRCPLCKSNYHSPELENEHIRNLEFLESLGKGMSSYPIQFNKALKEFIIRRDGYKCILCSAPYSKTKNRFHVHHIDYDKMNCNPSNLVTLCPSCHIITNYSRKYWCTKLNKKIKETYPLINYF